MFAELRAKLELVGAIVALVMLAGVTAWALIERAGRLECKVELVKAVDQARILGGTLERQDAALEVLGKQAAATISRTDRILGLLELQATGDRKTIASLRAALEAKTPRAADGSLKGCPDYLKEWRAEP